jgi:HK97 family phage major capsid protein
MKQLNELMHERSKVVEQQRSMIDRVKSEGRRDFNSQEQEEYQRMDEKFDRLTSEIALLKRRERLEERENFMKESMYQPNRPDLETRSGWSPDSIERRAWRKVLSGGLRMMTNEEVRALQADIDASGGYVVAPEQFVNEFIKELANTYWIRQFARVISVPNAASLGMPVRQVPMGDPTWTSELRTGEEDQDLSFSKRQLFPHPLARRILVSNKLLRVPTIDVEQLVRDEFVEQFGEVNENSFLNGTGANEPLGVFSVSSEGIGTDRDVSTGNTTTQIKTDGLIEALYSLKPQHRRNARWIFHRDAVKQIRKLKTGDGQYLWQPGMATDAPDTILGRPFHESEYAPAIFTTGLYVGIIGDFSRYLIADALDLQIQVLDQLYAATNQVGFIARMETDAMPLMPTAFCRIQLA